MAHDTRRFFIIGLPRSRTAWVSVALSVGDSYCFHDGLMDCDSFSDYLDRLNSRQEIAVGDSSPALPEHVQALAECFPDARWLILERSPDECRAALERAVPGATQALADGWGGIVDDFNAAREFLGDRAISMPVEALDDWVQFSVAARWLGASVIDHDRHAELLKLRITQRVAGPATEVAPPWWAADRLKVSGFATDGLAARYFSPDDLPMVDSWWRHRHPTGLNCAPLPPLGVVVTLDGEAVGALWLFEYFGCGVAQLTFPVTRPGLSFIQAQRVMAFAAATVMSLAGQRCDPPARYHTFTAQTSRPIARTLERLGFKEDTQKVSLTLTNSCPA